MKKFLSAAIVALISLSVNAQTWVEMMQDPEANFYDIQEAFNAHFDGQDPMRGTGWKQFKRWENFVEPRVYPHGNQIQSHLFYDAWKQAQRDFQDLSKDDTPWQPLGPTEWTSQAWNPGLGRVNAVIKHPTEESTVFVGTPAGGLWKSEDAGETWIPMTDNLPSIGVSGLAIDPDNTDVMYISTGDSDTGDTYSLGVLKSEDGGETWEVTGLVHDLSDGIRCHKLVMDPNDSQRLWVGTNDGLFMTTDGGDSWTESLPQGIRDIEVNPSNSDIVYAAGTSFFKSTDGGQNFTTINNGLPSSGDVNRLAIAVTEANSDYVYVLASDGNSSGFYGLYRSSNEGDSFIQRSNSPNVLTWSETGDGFGGQGWYDLAIAASPVDAEQIFVGGINVWKSNTGGNSWQINSHWYYPPSVGYTHADIHSLDFYGDELYCGSDGGVFVTDNAGGSWDDLSDGLQISQYYRIAVSTTNPDLVLTASQDNGTNLFTDPDTYLHILGGDGNAAAIDYEDDDIMYSAYPGGSFQRSTDGGQNFSGFTGGIDEDGAWVTPLEFHPTNPSILFAAYENVWKYENGSWGVLGNIPTSGTLRSLDIAPSNPDVIYTATLQAIFRSTNGGDSWQSISGGLPDVAITYIEVHPDDSDKLWVTFSGYDEGEKVYFSENGGDDWTNVSNNLPNIPVNCISYQLGSNDAIYIGTDAGVYYTDDSNLSWSSYNEGLPNVIVNQIVFQYQTSEVLLATYGRGVWKNQFRNAGALPPLAGFVAEPRLICEGGTVQYSNQSLNQIDDVLWTFEGGTPEQSTDINPTVTYETAGVYNAKLRVGNVNGLDSLTFDDYIQVLPAIGNATPIQEGFEDGDSLEDFDWFLESDDDANMWELNTGVGFDSDQCIWIENYGGPLQTSDFISSTTYDLSGLDTAFITMQVAYAKRLDSGSERLRVSISTDCGETWTFKKLFTSSSALPSVDPTDEPFVPSNWEEWNYLVVDNIDPEERTDNVRVRLEFRSNGGNNIYVDNINIDSELATSTKDIHAAASDIKVFPNPANAETTNLSLNMQSAMNANAFLVDALGRKVATVWQGKLLQGAQTISLNLEDVPTGYYIVTVRAEGENIAATPLVVE